MRLLGAVNLSEDKYEWKFSARDFNVDLQGRSVKFIIASAIILE